MFIIKRSVLFALVDYSVYCAEREGVCHPERKTKKCCVDFYQRGNNCFPCNGSVGLHCSSPCMVGFCGEQCQTKCPCDGADCDSHTCSCTVASNASRSNDFPQTTPDHLSSIFGVVFPVLFLSMAFFVLWISKRKRAQMENEDEKEIGPPGNAELASLTIDPEVDYAVIRESQVIDIADDYGDDNRTHTTYSLYGLDAEGGPESETHFYNVLRHT
ncbi:uncharacterized protein LOC144626990 [Crassostrea virginica]